MKDCNYRGQGLRCPLTNLRSVVPSDRCILPMKKTQACSVTFCSPVLGVSVPSRSQKQVHNTTIGLIRKFPITVSYAPSQPQSETCKRTVEQFRLVPFLGTSTPFFLGILSTSSPRNSRTKPPHHNPGYPPHDLPACPAPFLSHIHPTSTEATDLYADILIPPNKHKLRGVVWTPSTTSGLISH